MAVDDSTPAAKSRRLERSVVSSISNLPEHLQQEIFSRVGDVKSLFMFAVTSRGWLRRFTDRAFLRELFPSHGRHGARLLGVFLQDAPFNRPDTSLMPAQMAPPPPAQQQQRASSCAPTFLPAPGSPLGARRLVDDAAFDNADLLAAHRGIVLVRLAPRTPDEEACHLFGVCNPVTGYRHVLPPLEWSLAGSRLNGYAIVTAADMPQHHPPATARFKFSQLLVITQQIDLHYLVGVVDVYVHSYSAATGSWSEPTACLDSNAFSLMGDGSAVIHRGAAHWLCVDDGGLRYRPSVYRRGYHTYTLSVDVATARVSLTRIPVRVGGKQLLYVTGDGELAVASVYFIYVILWTQAAGGGGGGGGDTTPAWTRTLFTIPVAPVPFPHVDGYLKHRLERWCNFSHGSLLALFRARGVLILDLNTKAMEEVSIPDLHNKATIFMAEYGANRNQTWLPYEMDVVEFFMLHLGGGTVSEIGSP
jgi:hypothetical protein